MSDKPTFNRSIFIQGLFGGLIAAAAVYLVLWKSKFLSPLGTVIVPLLTLGVTSVIVYFYAQKRS